MLSKFKSGSFFNDIFRNFILLLLVPMITILFIFNHADKTVKMQVQESASQNLNLYYEQMEDIMKDMRATCYTILENSNCKTYALDTMQEYKLEIKLKRKIYEFLHNLIDTRYHDIFIYYGRDNKCVSGKNTALPAERYYEAYYSETGKVGYRDEFLDVIRTDTKQFACHVIRDYLGKEYLCMTIKVQNNKDTKNSYTICVVLAPEYLNDTWPMRDIDTEGIFLSYNSQDNLILNNAPEFHDMGIVTDLLGEDTKSNTWLDNEKYMICRRDSEIIKNKYLYIVPYESFWNELRQLRTYCFVGIAVCLVISIYFAYRSARRTYNPIGNIVEFIHSKEGGTAIEEKKQAEPDYIMSYIKSNESRLKEYKSGARELYLYNLLEGKQNGVDDAALTKSGITFPYKEFAVCLFEIEMALEEIADLRHFIIKNVFEGLGNTWGRAYFVEFGKNRCALLVNMDGGIENIESILEEGQAFIKQYYQIVLSIGLSSIHENMSEISDAYKEAQEALRYRFLMGRGCQIHYKDIAGRNLNRQGSGENKIYMLLLNYIKGEKETCDVEGFVESLGYIYEVNEEVSMDIAHFFKNEVITALSKIMLLNGYEKEQQKVIAEELTATDTLMEFKQKLSEQITRLYELNSCKKPKTDICARTRSFIDENYSNTQLSVAMIGQTMGMQAAHLSKLFKESYGISISDYIAQVRIEHAKRMIKEQHMSVQDTAERAGFINSHAFIRIFKKLENITPGKYKELCEK
ncbi:MAG: helix-turn-helix domain-containing protein [Lachnospiraceae bacterium]|nr:helix-turn-helix domain-containing protein [Lachnospiraceae bacterium]